MRSHSCIPSIVTVTSLMPGPTDTNFFHRAGMDDTKAGADKKDDPAEVAKQGFEALMVGKDNIIPGSLKTKILASASKVLPDTVNAELHSQLTKPGSANQKFPPVLLFLNADLNKINIVDNGKVPADKSVFTSGSSGDLAEFSQAFIEGIMQHPLWMRTEE